MAKDVARLIVDMATTEECDELFAFFKSTQDRTQKLKNSIKKAMLDKVTSFEWRPLITLIPNSNRNRKKVFMDCYIGIFKNGDMCMLNSQNDADFYWLFRSNNMKTRISRVKNERSVWINISWKHWLHKK